MILYIVKRPLAGDIPKELLFRFTHIHSDVVGQHRTKLPSHGPEKGGDERKRCIYVLRLPQRILDKTRKWEGINCNLFLSPLLNFWEATAHYQARGSASATPAKFVILHRNQQLYSPNRFFYPVAHWTKNIYLDIIGTHFKEETSPYQQLCS